MTRRPPTRRPALQPDEAAGAKIGEMTADGRIATLVGYVSAGPTTTGRRQRKASVPVEDLGFDVERMPRATAPAPAVPATWCPRRLPGPPSTDLLHTPPKATPPVRKLAKDLGVDLATVTPSRADGVISRAEIEQAAAGSRPVAPADHRMTVSRHTSRAQVIQVAGTGPRAGSTGFRSRASGR